ncbi:MAG: hypothetical protein KAI24_16275, partial [Planctomycetes bacterium]|nr:hypothetical protein [Planctomycetota bacterium]
MRRIALTMTLALAATCAAQEPSLVDDVGAWIETGRLQRGRTCRMLALTARRDGVCEPVIELAAQRAEDSQRSDAERHRAVELTLQVLDLTDFEDYAPRAQQVVARAVAHASSEPKWSARTRGRAIAATADLVGRDERRMWLLEGRVRLRAFLDDRLERLRPPSEELRGLLDYYANLRGDAAPAFDVLLQLYERDALPRSRRRALRTALRNIAVEAGGERADRLVAALFARVTARRPRVASRFVRDVEAVVAAHPASLAQPAATTFVPKAFTVVVRRVDEGYDAGVDGALFKWLRNLRAAV